MEKQQHANPLHYFSYFGGPRTDFIPGSRRDRARASASGTSPGFQGRPCAAASEPLGLVAAGGDQCRTLRILGIRLGIAVFIDEVGEITLNARPAGSAYRVTAEVKVKFEPPIVKLELLDKNAMRPSAGLD